jgi:cell division protein FtsL
MGFVKSGYDKVTIPHGGTVDVSEHRIDIVRFLMICMLLLTVVSTFHVWSRFRLIELNLQIGESGRQMKELEQEQRRLKLEAESLRTPARIEAIAKTELGMIAPLENQVVLVK